MAWYQKIKDAQSESLFQKQLMKQADTSIDNQKGEYFTLFDVQRYVMDSYGVRLAKSTTKRQIGVSLMISHNFLGTVAWNEYWVFDLDEESEADELYNKINEAVKETTEEFVDEQLPTSIFWPMLRSKLEKQNVPKQVSSNVPYVNFSKELSIEPDWRKNIYGPRYPDYKEVNYEDKTYGGRVGKQQD